MSLVELIARADERGLAASGLACLDRCVPLLGGDDELLRPLWGTLGTGGDTGQWAALLDEVRGKVGVPEDSEEDEAAVLAHRMLDAAPKAPADSAVREWAEACSVAALRIHLLLDAADDDTAADARREGDTEGMPPLLAAELRRQVAVLELLAQHEAGGLRPALEVCTEGRRVLRAVVSRRARGRG